MPSKTESRSRRQEIEFLLLKGGMTQTKIAEKVGVSKQWVNKVRATINAPLGKPGRPRSSPIYDPKARQRILRQYANGVAVGEIQRLNNIRSKEMYKLLADEGVPTTRPKHRRTA